MINGVDVTGMFECVMIELAGIIILLVFILLVCMSNGRRD